MYGPLHAGYRGGVRVRVCACKSACVHVCVCARACAFVYVCVHACVRARARARVIALQSRQLGQGHQTRRHCALQAPRFKISAYDNTTKGEALIHVRPLSVTHARLAYYSSRSSTRFLSDSARVPVIFTFRMQLKQSARAFGAR